MDAGSDERLLGRKGGQGVGREWEREWGGHLGNALPGGIVVVDDKEVKMG